MADDKEPIVPDVPRPGKKSMRAVYYTEPGGLERLQVGDRPKPEPAPGELLVKVRAAAVGMWDVNVLMGRFGDPPLPRIPGCEIAGVVESVRDVADFADGDEVYGYLGSQSGGFAQYATVASEHVVPKPEGISFEEAAALVVGPGTAYEGLVDRAGLQPGESVLITAASGGVGTSAVQIAAAVGARVLGVASKHNHDLLRRLGASETFDYHSADWVSGVREAVPDGVDVLFDGAGNATRNVALGAVKEGGRGVFIVGPPAVPRHDVEAHVFRMDLTPERQEAANRLVVEGKLKACVEDEWPFEAAGWAMAQVAAGHARGRVVLTVE